MSAHHDGRNQVYIFDTIPVVQQDEGFFLRMNPISDSHGVDDFVMIQGSSGDPLV